MQVKLVSQCVARQVSQIVSRVTFPENKYGEVTFPENKYGEMKQYGEISSMGDVHGFFHSIRKNKQKMKRQDLV